LNIRRHNPTPTHGLKPVGYTVEGTLAVLVPDVLVIGGGPAGAVAARLLAQWGHAVQVLARPVDGSRGLAESLPPSTRKLLAAVGVLDAVEGAGFYRTSGNTVWWGSSARRVERFDPSGDALGFQVFRPDLDACLLACAEQAGARVSRGAVAQRVQLDMEDGVRVAVAGDHRPSHTTARLVLDCTGRSGVVARQGFRRHEGGRRMQALIGIWQRDERWPLEDETHTLVESCGDGWAWSVPVSPQRRHVGVMVDGAVSRLVKGPRLADVYAAQLARTRELASLMRGARLDHVWACDASIYAASSYAGPTHLLVGDAASFIDPLSSFGVKKALASAWLAAVAAHTALVDDGRRSMAFDFFERRERQVYAAHRRRAESLAADARSAHAAPFWTRPLPGVVPGTGPDPDDDDGARLREPAVAAALAMIKARDTLDLVPGGAGRVPQPVIRGREIVLEDALVIGDNADRLRYLNGVDLLTLSELAPLEPHVLDLHAAYCRRHGAAPLPPVLGALAFLIAHGVVRPASMTRRG
jgi:flavin-dependent dehydrogenase